MTDCRQKRLLTSDLNHIFVTGGCLQVLVDCGGSVCLKVFIVGDQLHHTVPNLRSNVISRRGDELQDGVNIPLVLLVSFGNLNGVAYLGREAFCQDSNLQHHLLPQVIICHLQIPQQLSDDCLCICGITHRVQ